MNDREKLTAGYPFANALNMESEQWAAHAGVELAALETLTNDPAFMGGLDAENLRAEIDGRLLTPKARRIALKALHLIESQLEGMDAFEAAEILKHMQRLLDAEDRREAAKQHKAENLPVVHWTIIGGNVTFDVTPATPASIEVEPLQAVQDIAAKPTPDAIALNFDCTPLPIKGEQYDA
jgi:hypothetical protein